MVSLAVRSQSNICYKPIFRWGIKILSIQEGRGAGIRFSTLNDRSEPEDPVTMGLVWGMLLADVVIYGIIVWYIDNVKPGKYGVAKKPYFLFQKEYWCSSNVEGGKDYGDSNHADKTEFFEEDPSGRKAGVVVKNLKKVFKSIRRKLGMIK